MIIPFNQVEALSVKDFHFSVKDIINITISGQGVTIRKTGGDKFQFRGAPTEILGLITKQQETIE